MIKIKCDKCKEGYLHDTGRSSFSNSIIPLYKCDSCMILAFYYLSLEDNARIIHEKRYFSGKVEEFPEKMRLKGYCFLPVMDGGVVFAWFSYEAVRSLC